MATAFAGPSAASSASSARASVRVPLAQLKRGDRAIVELEGLPSAESALLAAMGLADRAEVRVCRSGGMCIVQIEATRLGIAAEMAARILATPCACFPADASHCDA